MKVGITTLALLNQKVFNENGTYFFEVLGYDMEDSDRIMGILRMENTDDVLESFILSVDSRFGSNALKAILLLLMGLVVILVFIISLIN